MGQAFRKCFCVDMRTNALDAKRKIEEGILANEESRMHYSGLIMKARAEEEDIRIQMDVLAQDVAACQGAHSPWHKEQFMALHRRRANVRQRIKTYMKDQSTFDNILVNLEHHQHRKYLQKSLIERMKAMGGDDLDKHLADTDTIQEHQDMLHELNDAFQSMGQQIDGVDVAEETMEFEFQQMITLAGKCTDDGPVLDKPRTVSMPPAHATVPQETDRVAHVILHG